MVKSKTLTKNLTFLEKLNISFKYLLIIILSITIGFSVANIILLLYTHNYFRLASMLDDMFVGCLVMAGLFLLTRIMVNLNKAKQNDNN